MRPGTHYAIDFVTPLPKSGSAQHDALLVICDRFSKNVVLVPTWTTASAKLTAEQFIKHIIYVHGIATEITSDQDVRFRFEESFWQNFFRYIGTALCMSSARHQNTNGTAERSIAYVEELLRMGINYEQNNWSQLCPRIQHSINTSKSSMGYSPYFVERGRHPLTALDRDVAKNPSRGPRV